MLKERVKVFSNSLICGQAGEELFYQLNSDKLLFADGYKFDFTLKHSGKTVELKSDYYDSEKTENFFMERFSDFHRKTEGGVWQSGEEWGRLLRLFLC